MKNRIFQNFTRIIFKFIKFAQGIGATPVYISLMVGDEGSFDKKLTLITIFGLSKKVDYKDLKKRNSKISSRRVNS